MFLLSNKVFLTSVLDISDPSLLSRFFRFFRGDFVVESDFRFLSSLESSFFRFFFFFGSFPLPFINTDWNEKALGETQTLCTGCSKAEPKILTLPLIPFPGAQDGQNLMSWRWSLPSPTDPVSWRSMHIISSYRGNRPTNKHTKPQTDKTDYNTLRSV